MAIREGAWDCLFCQRKRNRGPDKHCGGCGKPRGDDVKFYLPDDAKVVEDAAELARAQAGPDWTCSFCDGDNPGHNEYCSGCGSSRDPSKAREQKVHLSEPTLPVGSGPKKNSGLSCFAKVALVFVVGFVLFLGLGWFMSQTTERNLTVQSRYWERAIDVEKFQTVTETGWRSEIPTDARVQSSSREIKSYKQVQTGTQTKTRTVSEQVQTGTRKVKTGVKDLGNGYFEDVYTDEPVYETRTREETYEEPVYREDPVYEDKITYQVDRWKKDSQARLSGSDDPPRWPEVRKAEKAREGAREEKYRVDLAGDDGEKYQYEPATESEFLSFKKGMTVIASVSRTGEVKAVKF